MVLVTTSFFILISVIVYKSLLAIGSPLRSLQADNRYSLDDRELPSAIAESDEETDSKPLYKLRLGSNSRSEVSLLKMIQLHSHKLVNNTTEKKRESLSGEMKLKYKLQTSQFNYMNLVDSICSMLKLILENYSRRRSAVNATLDLTNKTLLKYRSRIGKEYLHNSREKRDNSKRYYFENKTTPGRDSNKLESTPSLDSDGKLSDDHAGTDFANDSLPLNETNFTTTLTELTSVRPGFRQHFLKRCQSIASCIHPFISYLSGIIMFLLVLYLIIVFGKCVCDDTY